MNLALCLKYKKIYTKLEITEKVVAKLAATAMETVFVEVIAAAIYT